MIFIWQKEQDWFCKLGPKISQDFGFHALGLWVSIIKILSKKHEAISSHTSI